MATSSLTDMAQTIRKEYKMKRRMRFGTWCRKDIEDERKIHYRFTDSNGSVAHFTSEDYVSYSMLGQLQQAWIKTIELKNNEWYADLYED